MFAVVLDDSISHHLMRGLLQLSEGKTVGSLDDPESTATKPMQADGEGTMSSRDEDQMLMNSAATFLSNTELFRLYDKRGHTDCMILAGGQVRNMPSLYTTQTWHMHTHAG